MSRRVGFLFPRHSHRSAAFDRETTAAGRALRSFPIDPGKGGTLLINYKLCMLFHSDIDYCNTRTFTRAERPSYRHYFPFSLLAPLCLSYINSLRVVIERDVMEGIYILYIRDAPLSFFFVGKFSISPKDINASTASYIPNHTKNILYIRYIHMNRARSAIQTDYCK